MARAATQFVLFAVLAAPAAVHALATEQVGNKPIAGGGGFSGQLLDAVNVEERVYWCEVNGNPTFYFKGAPKAINEAIRRFAAIPTDKREIILLAGSGATQAFERKPIAYDWSLHVPMGLHFDGDSEVADTRATLTIHIIALVPPPPADPANVKKWIGELNSDDFKTRERAAKDLAAVGPGMAPMLRQALKDSKAADVRDRLERVLAGVSGEVQLDVLELPADIAVISLETLLERARKELSNKAHDVRGYAMSSLSHRGATADEILPDVEKMLKGEKHEYPLRCTIGVASCLGTVGKPLLPTLRELLKSDDKNVQNVAQYAIEEIEKAKTIDVPEAESKTRSALRKEIREFVEKRKAKGK